MGLRVMASLGSLLLHLAWGSLFLAAAAFWAARSLLLVVPLRKKDLQFRKNGLLSREEEGGSDRWFGARGREWETTTHFNRNGVCWGAKDHISSAQKCILLTRHQKTMTPTQPLGGIPGQTFLSYKNGREVVRKKNNLALELGASFLSFCLQPP